MTSTIKKILASLLALVALALGGSAIASAMNDNPDSDKATTEKAEPNESANDSDSSEAAESAENESEGADDAEANGEAVDPGETVSAAASSKATAAAESFTGGMAEEVSTETNDAPEAGDESDPTEMASPSGAIYEVDVVKAGKDLKVYLAKDFTVLEVQADD